MADQIPAHAIAGLTTPADPRQLFRDDCAASALPAGVATSGVTFDSTELHRRLTGAAEYSTPAFALRGTIVVVAEIMHLSAYAGGDLQFQIMKGASVVCRIGLQSDGNIVAYDSAAAARGNTATSGSGPIDGQSLRVALTVGSNGRCSATVSNIGGGSTNSGNNSQTTWGIHTHRWASGLAGLTAGDALTAQLSQSKLAATDRLTGLARFVVNNGSLGL